MTGNFTIESQEVRKRAAEVRNRWSPIEKIRRTGLPPDVPTRLREFILGEPRIEWKNAVYIVANSNQQR